MQLQRSEVLGALVNGVFLVALCVSIFLEAIQRFFEPQTVTNPMLILIVGCCGLASNIVGLFLFHDHGHSHDEHEGENGSNNALSEAEAGRTHAVLPATAKASDGSETRASEDGNATKVPGQDAATDGPAPKARSSTRAFVKSDEDSSTAAGTTSPASLWKNAAPSSRRAHQRQSSSTAKPRLASFDDIPAHPASFRNGIIQAGGQLDPVDSGASTEAENDAVEPDSGGSSPTEGSHLLRDPPRPYSTPPDFPRQTSGASPAQRRSVMIDHQGHKHTQAHTSSATDAGHGHSHSDLNMRGVFIHVLGDALGNLGVIASALFIWLSTYSWRFYADPLISLLITLIILKTALPLCRASSRILLQAVPAGLSVDDIRADIEQLPGVEACHHLHVWQLSGQKLVASLHVRLACNFPGCGGTEGAKRYMSLAKAVRDCLHAYGIRQSTIQPEFCLATKHGHASASVSDGGNGSGNVGRGDGAPGGRPGGPGSGLRIRTPGANRGSAGGSRATSGLSSPQEACLLEGDVDCAVNKCCVTPGEREQGGHGH